VERLQEEVVAADIGGQKERSLYQKADTVLSVLIRLEHSLKADLPRDQLAKAFDQMDQQLHELLRAVEALGEEQRYLQRAAGRVRTLDRQLHYQLFAGESGKDRARQVLEGQTSALAAEAKELERTAQYALLGRPGRDPLAGDLRKLTEAAESLRASAAGGGDPQSLQRDFKVLNEIWARVTNRLKDLTPGENVYLLRSAGQVDRLLDRLHRLLGVEGERPQLIIRS
jgi:hypothetical protein